MKLENKGNAKHIKVTLPSGKKSRLTLPEGKFDLPNSYVIALKNHPVGAVHLKKMRIKPKKAPKNDPQDKIEDKSTDTEGA